MPVRRSLKLVIETVRLRCEALEVVVPGDMVGLSPSESEVCVGVFATLELLMLHLILVCAKFVTVRDCERRQ